MWLLLILGEKRKHFPNMMYSRCGWPQTFSKFRCYDGWKVILHSILQYFCNILIWKRWRYWYYYRVLANREILQSQTLTVRDSGKLFSLWRCCHLHCFSIDQTSPECLMTHFFFWHCPVNVPQTFSLSFEDLVRHTLLHMGKSAAMVLQDTNNLLSALINKGLRASC